MSILDKKMLIFVQAASAARQESAANLGVAEFPQGGFIPAEDVK